MLSALAARFHPVRAPWWDWDTRAWWWEGPDGGREMLGRDYAEAQTHLVRLGGRLRCHHGKPLAGAPCSSCRAEVVAQARELAAH